MKATLDLTAGQTLASVTSPFHGSALILFPVCPISSQSVQTTHVNSSGSEPSWFSHEMEWIQMKSKRVVHAGKPWRVELSLPISVRRLRMPETRHSCISFSYWQGFILPWQSLAWGPVKEVYTQRNTEDRQRLTGLSWAQYFLRTTLSSCFCKSQPERQLSAPIVFPSSFPASTGRRSHCPIHSCG